MSDSWKNEGGKKVNNIIDSTKDITNKYYNTESTLNTNDKEGVYFYKENGPSIVGFGTKTPYSRVSFGDYNVNNISDGIVKDENLANNASIALSEKADGANATGISYYRDGTSSSEIRGIRFTVNNNSSGDVQNSSLETRAAADANTLLMLLNDGTSQKVLINSKQSLFSNTSTGLEVNGDIHLTKSLIFNTSQSSSTVNKAEGVIFYDYVDKKMKWIIGTGADIHTIAGINDTSFAIDSSKYDASFAVIEDAQSGTGLLAFKDLGLCIGNGEMLTTNYLEKFRTTAAQNLPALSIIGHHQNGVASNANVLISNINNVTGEAILSKTSPIDLSANGVIYLLNNLTIDKYEPEAIIDVSKINVPFLSMGSDITNYYNSIVIGEDISGSSNSFYFGKDINNQSSYDASFNFVFGDTLNIDSNATNFENNFIFGSGHSFIGGDHNLIFGNNLSTNNDVSFCILLGNGSGTAQNGDLIKYFEDGNVVFHLKSGGNLLLGGDISANDASFNNVVFSNIGNETSKIKLAYVKGISSENISIENSLTIGGKLTSTSDISANDASFNNVDINNLKSYGNFVINGNIDTTGYANFGGDISANDASFNNVDINNLKNYGNAVINGNIDATGYANFGGDISANDASFNSININIGDINELKNVQKINFDSTSNLLIQKSNASIITITNNGMLIGGELDANSLKIDGKVFDATASSSWASGNSKKYTGNSNGLYIPLKIGINFNAPAGNENLFFPKFPLDVSGVIRSQNQVFGHLSIDLVPQPLSDYTNTIANAFYGSGVYDASENIVNASNPVWKLFDNATNTYWESTGNGETVVGVSGGDVNITGKYLEIKLPERCTLKHYAFKSSAATKLPKIWTIIGKIGLDGEVTNSNVNNTWKIIDYKSESVQYGANGEFVYFTVDNLKYSNDMYKVFRIYITETFIGTTEGIAPDNQCQISELKLFGEPSNINDISSSLIQTELFDISNAELFKQKHLSLQPMSGNVGIRTNNPSVILDISANNAIRLPMGNTLERPLTVDASGCLRYNTETKQFEGYGDAGWAGLGGVIDKDQDTYIAAEENTDEDKLRFYTKGVERMVINDSGVVDVSGLLQSKEISGNSVNATFLKTDGLVINNKTIVKNNITGNSGWYVNKQGYFDIISTSSIYVVNGYSSWTIYAYPGSVLQFNLDGVNSSHPFNIFKDFTNSTTGTTPSGLQHVADNRTITKDAAAQAKNSGTLIWFVPYDAIGEYRYQCSNHSDMNGLINILPMPSDVSANDISGENIYANSLRSNGIVINGDISGNTATFANGIMNTLAISDNLDCSNAFIKNLDCSSVFITDLSANDISGGHVYTNTLTIAGDLSGNNALLHDVSVNRLWVGDVEMIGAVPGTLLGNMVINGDLSGNNAKFNDISGVNFFTTGGNFIGNLVGNAATATNVAYTGLTGTIPTWNQNTSGNAATATKLAVGRYIGNVEFDGTASITPKQIQIINNNTNNVDHHLLFNQGNTNLAQQPQSNPNIKVNPSTNTIYATNFSGNATTATKLYISDYTSSNDFRLCVTDAVNGHFDVKAGGSARYNPNTNVLTAGTFQGNLTGNVTATSNVYTPILKGLGLGDKNDPPIRYLNNATGIFFPSNTTVAITCNATEVIRCTNLGYVGIGATSPSVPLEVNRASSDNIAIFSRTDSTLVDLAFSGSNGYACMLANVSNNSYGIKIAAKHNSFPAGNQDDGIFVRADGNVGIGTNAPYSKLHVIKNLRVGYEYDSKAGIVLSDEDGFGGNYPNIQSITKAGDINNLTLNPVGGNVGIGTNSPTYPLQIKGGATSAKACQLMIENLSYNKGIEFRYKSVSGTTYDFPQAKIYTSGSSYDTKLHFSTAVGTTNANTTAVEVMTLDSAGNVGIGTNSPTYMLEVISEAQVSDPNFTPTYWYGSLYCGHTNGGITLGRIGPTHTNCIQSRYGGAGSSLAINPFGGNVGIGTTSPGDKLEVNSGNIILKGNTPRIKFYSNNGTYGNEILSNHSDSVNYGLQIYTPITSFWYSANYSYCSIQNRPNQDRPHGQFYLHYGYNNGSDRNVGVFLSASPSENNYINNGGNVGIGTNSPRATFNVSRNISNNSAGTTIPSNYGGNDTTTCVLGMGLPGSTQNYYGLNIGTIYNGDSYIQSCHINSSSFYSILLNPKGGNVGIGTTTATYTLNVGGDTMTSEWYRTNASGDQGWYSNTHGGGIYMSDSSWVRIYNKPCYISKSKNENFNGYYFSSGTSGDGVHYSNATSSVSLRTAEGIVGKWIGAYSDRRIKKNIEDINDSDALKLLRKIPVRYYNYKDEIMYGKERVSGFIAQEVKEIFPIAVSTAPYKNYIPSILKKITNEVWEEKINDLSDNEWILTNFDVIDTSGVVGPIDISSGTLYDFYLNDDENSIEEEKEVLADNNGNFIFKKKWENLYLYGICVNDFLILDKNKIFALNFSASQEIDRIQQAEKAKLEEQTTEIILLKNKIATLESQYYNLQQQVQTLIDNQ